MVLAIGLVLLTRGSVRAQPVAAPDGVRFVLPYSGQTSVSVVGDFNGWAADSNPMSRDGNGAWTAFRRLGPGLYQYKFLVDGRTHITDPNNPATIENYNRTALNSVFAVTEEREVVLTATAPALRANPDDKYESASGHRPVYLNIIWHQHQPLYVNPATDQLSGPWVRTHATKDYYDMAAMLRDYPDIHCTINLTSSLLVQLEQYYVARLRPFVDMGRNTIDIEGFWKEWKGKTDPWIDLALTPTESFGSTERDFLYRNAWNALGISEVQVARFPDYERLRRARASDPNPSDTLFSVQELRELKFWFYLAHFDPDFLRGPVVLPDRSVCDLSDLVAEKPDGSFHVRRRVSEEDCRRLVVESVKVMANVLPIHRAIRYDPSAKTGQAEIITTPYYHPILPLIYDSDLARTCQPDDAHPPRFSYPEDADAQVAKAVTFFQKTFGSPPTGMWPGEGSVAQPVLEVLRRHGVLWTASDVKVLQRSKPADRPNTSPYAFPAGKDPIALVFRDTDLSDRIGFKYQSYEGEVAAEDFVKSILAFAPPAGAPDVLITVILDGENAWEWYRKDNDAKKFLNALYRKLSRLHMDRRIITVTTTEYIQGNPARSVPAHPVEKLPQMTWLWPGSWINGNYDTWIGEAEENRAWEYLLQARKDLERSGLPKPDPAGPMPPQGTPAWYAVQAWEAMYAAEGSDWFWWYGADQSAPGGDSPFDVAFRTHLANVYSFARRAGAAIEDHAFEPIIRPAAAGSATQTSAGGTMAQGSATQTVLFTCDARSIRSPRRLYITGNIAALGSWKPNVVRMHDDGTHGDSKAGDNIWSLEVTVPVGKEIQYTYTNNGNPGQWTPGEEFPSYRRTFTLTRTSASPVVREDIFGQRTP